MGDLSLHFNRSEFACPDLCGLDTVDAELLSDLDSIRTHFERPVTINSGCRCPEYNRSVGGAENSQHLLGRAADIVVDGITPALVQELAEQLDVHGLGEYSTFTHIDSRNGTARW